MKSQELIGGKYRLTQRLGSGAMGVVWEAINELTGCKVALKLILHPTDQLRQRLLREARACGSLEHRNIVKVYDVVETKSGDPLLVMQLLSGETLGELLRRKRRIEPPLAASIGRDIASALAAAHDAKIIHRDLKPANIFLHRERDAGEGEFVLKVLDFGVSKSLASGEVPATITGMVVGSPAYMSPEQVRMDKDLDQRTDLWSLGIILFEMLTGVRPFRGTAQQMMGQVILAAIPPVSSRVRHVAPELDAIVARCLERDCGKRFQEAKELARALAAYAEMNPESRGAVSVLPATPASAAWPAIGGAAEATPLSMKGQTGLGSLTATTDSADAEVTLLFRRGEAMAAPAPCFGAAESSGSERSPASTSPVRTQLLSHADLMPSPMPAWRLELQQVLAASRQASTALDCAPFEELQQGGTMTLWPQTIAQMPAGDDARGTITAPLPPLTPERTPAEPLACEGAPASRARRGSAWMVATVGAGVLTIAALAVIFWTTKMTLLGRASPRAVLPEPSAKPAPVEGPIMSAHPEEPIPSTAPTAVILPSTEPAIVPSASASANNLPAPFTSFSTSPPQVQPTRQLPVCGKFIKLNCRKSAPIFQVP